MIKREYLAIKWSMTHFCCYMLGQKFTLITNHARLKWLQDTKFNNNWIMQWALALKPFCCTVEHWPRKQNITTNFLSQSFKDPDLRTPVTAPGGQLQKTLKRWLPPPTYLRGSGGSKGRGPASLMLPQDRPCQPGTHRSRSRHAVQL